MNLLLGCAIAAMYMGLEPYVRRRWPQVLIGWTRVLSGRFRDPIVGTQVLVGIAGGFANALAQVVNSRITDTQSPPGGLLESSSVIALFLTGLAIPPAIALGYYWLFVLLRLVLRRTWITAAAVLSLPFLLNGLAVRQDLVYQLLQYTLLIVISIRFGLLAAAILPFASSISVLPLTSDFSAWYAPTGWLGAGLFLALSVWGFRNALGGRKLLQRNMLDN
jgi:hypothetical protein